MLIFVLIFPKIVSATIFQPGETLEPDCAPGSSNCGVAVTTSALGTTTPITNSILSVTATSTNSILATLRAFAGQIANLFQVQNSSGTNLFSIGPSGAAQFSSTMSVTGSTTLGSTSIDALFLGSLNGPLQANAGVVSATTSVGVVYGGTGLTAAPVFGNLLVGNSSGGYTLTATSSLGIVPSLSGTTTTALAEGSNLYFTTNRVASVIAATTTDALAQGATNKYYSSDLFAASLAGTTTTALAEGNNLYFTNTRVQSFVHASSTIPKTYTANTFTANNTFANGLTVDSLNGPLQANSGVVSATTSIGVLYGGTGLTSAPIYGQLLVGNSNGGYTLTATSSLGLGGGSGSGTVTSINASGGTTGLVFSGGPVTTSGTLTLSGTLTVGNGGTGATSFNQGWLFSTGDGNALSASTSPTVNFITATSTTATSTFANGINITSGCFAKNGVCINAGGGGGAGSDLQYVTSYKTDDAFINITNATTTLTSVSITPATATGDIMVRAGVTFTSSNSTDQALSIAIRQTSCAGAVVENTGFAITVTAGSGRDQHFDLNYIAVDPGTGSQTYALCVSTPTGDTDISDWNMSAIVIDTGADLAEVYTTNDPSLEAGDVVAYDPDLKTGVKKSLGMHDLNVLGIISMNPGMVIGGVSKEGVKAVPVALSGRVPVKVTTENGAIVPGDYLTLSSVPGVAMKSDGKGSVIGQALSAYDGVGVGTVLVFVKNFNLGNEAGLLDGIVNFIATQVTAIRGYFEEIFAKKVHTEELCIKKSDGAETCVTGDQLNSLIAPTSAP